MILPFITRKPLRSTLIDCQQDALARTVMELFPDRPVADFEYAIRAGNLALANGDSFFEAIVAVDEMFKVLDDANRARIMRLRNCERFTAYRIKRLATKGE